MEKEGKGRQAETLEKGSKVATIHFCSEGVVQELEVSVSYQEDCFLQQPPSPSR